MKIYSDAIQKEIRRISENALGLQWSPEVKQSIKNTAEFSLQPYFGFPLTVEVSCTNGIDLMLKISKKVDFKKFDFSGAKMLPYENGPSTYPYYNGTRRPGECFLSDCPLCR